MNFVANIPRETLVLGAAHTTSKGNQVKWITKNKQVFVKECYTDKGRVWRDDLVEVIASTYGHLCDTSIVPVLRQSLCTVEDRPASASINFLKDGEVFITFWRLIDTAGIAPPTWYTQGAADNYKFLCDAYRKTTGLDASKYLLGMAALDCVIGNEDRHLSNFGVIYNERTAEYRLCPLFDFGLGMFGFSPDYDNVPYLQSKTKVTAYPFATKSDKVAKWLRTQHQDFLHEYLPRSVSLSDFEFPTAKARRLFADRNKELGVEVLE